MNSSPQPDPDEDIQAIGKAWEEEVVRRMDDLEAGRATTVSWESLHTELLKLVGEP